MADDSLLSLISPADLAGFNNQVTQSDPFGIAGNSLASWQPNYSYMDATESGLTSFGKAFAQGLLQNYAQNNASQQLGSVINVLPQLSSDPMSTIAPEGVDSSAFNMLRGSAYLNKVKRDEEAKANSAATLADLFKSVGIEGIKSGTMDPRAAVDLVTTGKLPETGVVDPLANPNSPAYKVNQDLIKEADSARSEISKLPAVQKLNIRTSALAEIAKLKDIDSKSSDIPFATLFIGGLDGSTVREGEYDRVGGSNPVLQKYRNMLEGVLNGKSELGVDIKRQMFNELSVTQQGLLEEANKQAESRLNTALSRGVKNKLDALPFDPARSFGDPFSGKTQNSVQFAGSQVPADQAKKIIAYAKMQYGDTPKAREVAEQAIKQMMQPKSAGGTPIG